MPPPDQRTVQMPTFVRWHRPDGHNVHGWIVQITNLRTTTHTNASLIVIFAETLNGHLHEVPLHELRVTAGQMLEWNEPI